MVQRYLGLQGAGFYALDSLDLYFIRSRPNVLSLDANKDHQVEHGVYPTNTNVCTTNHTWVIGAQLRKKFLRIL